MKKLGRLLFRLPIVCCGLTVLGITLGIFFFIFQRGWGIISFSFIFESPKGVPTGTEGGVFPAIMGTLYLGLSSGLLSGALAISGAIYVTFFCKKRGLARLVQVSLQCLSGLPSILFGLVGYSVLIFNLGLPRSLLTACLTVSAMIFPFIFIRVQKILQSSPLSLMRTSLALGLSKPYIITRIILPSALPEIAAAVLLGMTYGMGAAAPVIFTGAVLYAPTPTSFDQPFMSLAYHLYILVNDGISTSYAYGTACVLLMLVLILNTLCRLPDWIKRKR